MKPLGVSIWIWCVGTIVALGIGISVATMTGDPPKPEVKSPASSAASEKRTQEAAIKSSAETCLFHVKAKLLQKMQAAEAELELKEKRTAGEAQLQALNVSDARKKLSDAETKANECCEKLSNLEGSRGTMGRLISSFEREGATVIHQYMLEREYKGFTPKTAKLHAQALYYTMSATLKEITSGEYPGIVAQNGENAEKKAIEREKAYDEKYKR